MTDLGPMSKDVWLSALNEQLADPPSSLLHDLLYGAWTPSPPPPAGEGVPPWVTRPEDHEIDGELVGVWPEPPDVDLWDDGW